MKSKNERHGGLLVVLLTGKTKNSKPHITAGPLVLKHAQKHIALHGSKNSAFVIADQNGNIKDIKDVSLEENKEYFIENTSKAQKSVKKLLPNLKNNVSKLKEADYQYDKILVIGSTGIDLTLDMANSLKEFNKNKLKKNGLIRFQICSFKDKEIINHKEKNFVQEVTPSDCKLSIPEVRSIVSEFDTRAVDCYDPNFSILKKPLKMVLRQKNSNIQIHDEIKKNLSLNKDTKDKVDELLKSIKFIQEDGNEIVASEISHSDSIKINSKNQQKNKTQKNKTSNKINKNDLPTILIELNSALNDIITIIENKAKALNEDSEVKNILDASIENNLEQDTLKSFKEYISKMRNERNISSEQLEEIKKRFDSVFETKLNQPLQKYVEQRKFLKSIQDFFHDVFKRIFGRKNIALSTKSTLSKASCIFFKMQKKLNKVNPQSNAVNQYNSE